MAQGVPFAREYGGLLDNRSFGGAQVSRTFYARGQTGQQLLIGAYQSMMRQVERGTVKTFANREMLDLVLVNGQARGIVCRNLSTGAIERYAGHAVLLCTGGYGTAYYLSTNAVNSNVTAAWRAHKRGAFLANPCYTQIHPTCIPVSGTHQSKLTLMSESLRNDGRVWVPKSPRDRRPPADIPEAERDYYLERRYPSFGNLVPRDVASRNAKAVCDEGHGVGESGLAVYLDFSDAIRRLGDDVIRARYGNLFDMYRKITDEDPFAVPMRIYPAIHYTMGGLWVDYNLMSTIPGLHVLGEANFSDHGANRLGASALMQGLADGYFVIPSTLAHYLSSTSFPAVTTEHDAFNEAAASVQTRIDRLLAVKGTRTPRQLHRDLGALLWDKVGMARNDAGLRYALERIPAAARGILAERIGARPGHQPQQEPRVRRPRGRLPRVCRSPDARRAAAHRVVRRPFPRGEPDARRRGPARRRPFLARLGLGVPGNRPTANAAQRTADVRVRQANAAELQVELSCEVHDFSTVH